MNTNTKKTIPIKYGKDSSCLTEIFHISKSGVRFFLDQNAELHWNFGHNFPKPLATIPPKLQLPFFIKFIQNHELAEKVKYISDPIVCIELYIKAKFFINGDLDLDE